MWPVSGTGGQSAAPVAPLQGGQWPGQSSGAGGARVTSRRYRRGPSERVQTCRNRPRTHSRCLLDVWEIGPLGGLFLVQVLCFLWVECLARESLFRGFLLEFRAFLCPPSGCSWESGAAEGCLGALWATSRARGLRLHHTLLSEEAPGALVSGACVHASAHMGAREQTWAAAVRGHAANMTRPRSLSAGGGLTPSSPRTCDACPSASDPEVSTGTSAWFPPVGLDKAAVSEEDLPPRAEIILETGAGDEGASESD